MSDETPPAGPLNPEDADRSVDPSSASVAAVARTQCLPASIGRYRIIRLLGEGGMGAVYEAEQDQPRRRVALKVIKSAWASPELLRRFELEFQTLGRLHHPGIAQIYEAGSADTGVGPQPFFAMEMIQGKPLVHYARAAKLTTRQRLALMIQVCEGVQHAHERGIIHRDLKPGNILVDGSGQPKILDFGLALVTDSDALATRQTGLGQVLGTLAYMSPEQAQGDLPALDARSDIYALGVIVYELLAEKLPYQLSRHLHEAVETIAKVDPAPLSSVSRAYRGDVETIVAKALEKDKTRRYGSAAEFAEDMRRYLEDRPITAKPASASYQLQKFVRRHKTLVAGTAAVFVVLVAGVVVSTWQAVQARRAETRAQTEAASAQAIAHFLEDDLLGQASANNQSGPSTKPDPDLKVRTALDRAAERIEGKFAKQPEVEAAIRSTIGQTYLDLGLYPEARKQLERALDLQTGTLGPEHPGTVNTLNRLGRAADLQGDFAEAEALSGKALEVQRRVLGPEHPDTLNSMSNLANIYREQGKYAPAEALQLQILNTRRRLLGPEHRDTLNSMSSLANIYREQGKYTQTEALDLQVLDAMRRVLGPEHPDTLACMNNLAITYFRQGKYAQAEVVHRQALEIQRRVLGPEHPRTLVIMNNLGYDYSNQGKYAQAEALDRKVLEIRRRMLGPEDPLTLTAAERWAVCLSYAKQYGKAEVILRDVVQKASRSQGREPLAQAWYNFACAAAVAGYKDSAIEYLQKAVDSGFTDTESMADDHDLKNLRDDPRLTALIAKAKEKARFAAAQAPK
jgi:tetratricopeptide (TPR) repeat protein